MTLKFEDVGVGGDIIQPLDAGSYEAMIVKVTDGEFPSFKDPGAIDTKYMIDWEFDGYFEMGADGVMTDKMLTLRQFVRVPPSLVQGSLSDRTKLYEVLQALRLLPAGEERFHVDPDEWIGLKALVLVEKQPISTGANAGKERPVIAHVAPPLRKAKAGGGDPELGNGQQALLTALTAVYGGRAAQKMMFLDENQIEGENVLAMVTSLEDSKAYALARKLETQAKT